MIGFRNLKEIETDNLGVEFDCGGTYYFCDADQCSGIVQLIIFNKFLKQVCKSYVLKYVSFACDVLMKFVSVVRKITSSCTSHQSFVSIVTLNVGNCL